MANEKGVNALKLAFDKGYISLFNVEKNERGFYVNLPNPYAKDSLTYKEFERGYNQAYTDAKKKAY